ncbi:MAG TPA: hypothetical protein VF510_05215 [Ktedonobacterales bacterium]
MLYNILTYVGFGIVLVGLLALLWYLQPRKLSSNPESDGDLRLPSDRARQDAYLYRMQTTDFGRGFRSAPTPIEDPAEKERQAQLGRFDDSGK